MTLLFYVIAINVENSLGSQRYIVEGIGDDGTVNSTACLTMTAGVTKEMELQKSSRMSRVTREKLGIVTKWLQCGVL